MQDRLYSGGQGIIITIFKIIKLLVSFECPENVEFVVMAGAAG